MPLIIIVAFGLIFPVTQEFLNIGLVAGNWFGYVTTLPVYALFIAVMAAVHFTVEYSTDRFEADVLTVLLAGCIGTGLELYLSNGAMHANPIVAFLTIASFFGYYGATGFMGIAFERSYGDPDLIWRLGLPFYLGGTGCAVGVQLLGSNGLLTALAICFGYLWYIVREVRRG